MTTNLLAWITFGLVTNWTTVSRTIPAEIVLPGGGIAAVYQPMMLNQIGLVSSNVYINFVYEGATNTVCVKETHVGMGGSRSVPETTWMKK